MSRALISAGLNLPVGSEGHDLATQLAQIWIDGEHVENARLGELARSTEGRAPL